MKALSLGNLRRVVRHLGQGMTEFIIIVMVVAVGSIFVYTQFGDVLRNQMAAATKTLAGQDGKIQTADAQRAADAASQGTNRNLGNAASSGSNSGSSGGGSGSGMPGGSGSGNSGGDGESGGSSGGGDAGVDNFQPPSAGAGGSDGDEGADVPGADSFKPPSAAQKQKEEDAIARKPKSNPLDDPEVRTLIALSPTLQADLAKLKVGVKGEWEIQYTTGMGHVDYGRKIIFINNGGPLTPTNARGTVGALAHEVGHALLHPRDFFSREQWENKEAFVQRALEGEGAAVIKNIQIQQEILTNGGVDKNIGVDCGIPPCSASALFNQKGRYDDIYDQYLKDGDVDKARRDIADLRAVEELNDGRTYKKYYEDVWDDLQRQQRQSQNPGTP